MFVSMSPEVPERRVNTDWYDTQQLSEDEQAGRTQRHERLHKPTTIVHSSSNDDVHQLTRYNARQLLCRIE